MTVAPELGTGTGARGSDVPFYTPGSSLVAWRTLWSGLWDQYLEPATPGCFPNA